MMKLAVLISNAGTGTNLQAIINAIEEKKLSAQITIVVSDSQDAYGLVRAQKNNITTYIINGKNETLELLLREKFPVDYVVLAGWKKIISDSFIDAFSNRILNIHPGLIPDIPTGHVKNPDGTNAIWNKSMFTTRAIQNFLDNKATYAGSTVHFLTKDFDFGKVLGRCFEKIQQNDTVESLYTRLKQKENTLLIQVLTTLSKESK